MIRERDDDIDLSVLTPPMQPAEALSSWLVRIADAHLITVAELERDLGGPVAGLDRGDPTLLPRLAAMTRVPLAVLARVPLADLIAHPMRPGPRPPACWAICARCLQRDIDQGRAPYVRRAWTHPLAVFCAEHGIALAPHGHSPIKIASELTFFDADSIESEPRDAMLETASFDAIAMVQRVWRALGADTGARRLEHRLRLRWAVRDVVDALATNRREPRGGSLASLFERPLFDRKSLQGSNQLQLDWLADVDAATRLLYVRLALMVLAEPPDPAEEALEPLGRSWLLNQYQHSRIRGWQSVFTHAIRDLFFLLVTELPRTVVLELSERTRAWPADLRRRWTYGLQSVRLAGLSTEF
jgi:hypothetical protein